MKFIRELRFFSRKSLKGHYAAAWRASMLWLGIWLMLKLIPALLAGVLIVSRRLTPGGLFFGKERLWVMFAVLWEMMAFCILAPVGCGVRSWFTHLVELERAGQERQFFRTTGAFCRGIYFFGAIELIRWLAVLPLVAACTLTAFAFRQSAAFTEGGLWLFAAVQGIAAAFWAGWYYIKFCISLLAVPYIFLTDPECTVLGAIRASRRILSGRYGQLAALLLPYLPAAAPVVTVPFLLPRLLTDVTLYFQLRIREYEADINKAF